MKNHNRTGFTMIEIMVIVIIIGILAAMIVPAVKKINERANIIAIEQKTEREFHVVKKEYIDDRYAVYVVKHKTTGVLYFFRGDFMTVLLDKDGKPLVSY